MDTNYRNYLMQALGQTADWFRRALAVEPVKGSLRLSGYSACGQDGGVQLPREYVEGIFFATNQACFVICSSKLSSWVFSSPKLDLPYLLLFSFLFLSRWCCGCRLSSSGNYKTYNRQHSCMGSGMRAGSMGSCNCW